jgi:hypothetical protein
MLMKDTPILMKKYRTISDVTRIHKKKFNKNPRPSAYLSAGQIIPRRSKLILERSKNILRRYPD